MLHAKEHPLAHRVVVPHGYLLTGETVRVIDWLDRCGELVGAEVPPNSRVSVVYGRLRFRAGWGGSEPVPTDQAVAVIGRGAIGPMILHARELPSYDPGARGVRVVSAPAVLTGRDEPRVLVQLRAARTLLTDPVRWTKGASVLIAKFPRSQD